MSDEIEIPDRPPVKRRALENSLDKWLAVWANDEALSPSERRRAQAERDRRKKARPTRVAGVIVGNGGASPEQLKALTSALRAERVTDIHHVFTARRVHAACKSVTGAKIHVSADGDPKAIVRGADIVVGVPSDRVMPVNKVGIWEVLRFAKDRGVDVKVIWADGSVLEGRW